MENSEQHTTDTPQAAYDDIKNLFAVCEPFLREAGIEAARYRCPEFDPRSSLKRLRSVYAELNCFNEGEYFELFRRARNLHSPGVLAHWAGDKNMRTARDVEIFIAARSLFRQAWYGNKTLKTFFKVRSVSA